jgi:hypothetical protein
LTDETGTPVAAHINIELRLVSGPEPDFMKRVDADIARLDSSSLANVSGHIDATTTVAQAGSSVAQTLGTCIGPLGRALQLMVKFMDSVEDVCYNDTF